MTRYSTYYFEPLKKVSSCSDQYALRSDIPKLGDFNGVGQLNCSAILPGKWYHNQKEEEKTLPFMFLFLKTNIPITSSGKDSFNFKLSWYTISKLLLYPYSPWPVHFTHPPWPVLRVLLVLWVLHAPARPPSDCTPGLQLSKTLQ